MNKRQRKKNKLGKKINKKKLRELLRKSMVIKENGHSVDIYPYEFCPSCGCKSIRFVSYPVEYPEAWNELLCNRCNSYVGGQDNSYYEYAIETIANPIIKNM